MAPPRRIVVALDSFKGSIGAAAACAALRDGWLSARPDDVVTELPMADGGEGTRDAFERALPGARRMPVTVAGPHGRAVDAHWLAFPDGTGVIELASTSGIELLGDDLRPWDADTLGFGEAIADALDHGVERLVLGIGSSASTDGGMGLLTALGARFLDATGSPVATGARGLAPLASVDLMALRQPPRGGVIVVTDVDAPLCGPRGAASVFGPQKGLAAADVSVVDDGLRRLAELVGIADPHAPGAGAAGGTGFALLAWGATLAPGAAEVGRLIGLDDAIATADLVITGEGSYDGQSTAGKAPAFVADLARTRGVPVALVAGRMTGRMTGADAGRFAIMLSLTDLAGSAEAAMSSPERWLREAGKTLAARSEAVPGQGRSSRG